MLKQIDDTDNHPTYMTELVLLGIAQDGGRPQAGCSKSCCIGLGPNEHSFPTSLGIIGQDKLHIIDVTRSLGNQLQYLDNRVPDEVWLTHAHIGHIDGLGLFGRETMNVKGAKLHVSKLMLELINQTPHWQIMIQQGVFSIDVINNGESRQSTGFSITPILVPHRGELSDTHAFIIRGDNKSLLYLPDHDSWDETLSLYGMNTIREWLASLQADIALIDGTFWSYNELSERSQQVYSHPPIKQTIGMLGYKQQGDPDIIFFHLNHTNPVYDEWSEEHTKVVEMGWSIAKQGMRFKI